jgi:hypothetical protein
VIKTVTEAVVDGYGPGEVALIPRLTEGEPQMRQAFEANVIEPLLAVVLSDGETAVLKIEGHSDREDSPGLSREQRRQSELAASVARANSATDGAFELLAFEFPGLFPASDWAEVAQVGRHADRRGRGAAGGISRLADRGTAQTQSPRQLHPDSLSTKLLAAQSHP